MTGLRARTESLLLLIIIIAALIALLLPLWAPTPPAPEAQLDRCPCPAAECYTPCSSCCDDPATAPVEPCPCTDNPTSGCR